MCMTVADINSVCLVKSANPGSPPKDKVAKHLVGSDGITGAAGSSRVSAAAVLVQIRITNYLLPKQQPCC